MTSAPPPAPPVDPPPAWEPPPPPAGPPVRPQLRRSRTDKILGGVNGGLAEYTGIYDSQSGALHVTIDGDHLLRTEKRTNTGPVRKKRASIPTSKAAES